MERAQHFVERHGLDAPRTLGAAERHCSALVVRLGLVVKQGVVEHPCDRIGLRLRHAASVARRRRRLNSICVVERIERIVALLASRRGR